MLPTTLSTNEVKDNAGTEQEFTRLKQTERQLEFGLTTEAPYTPHRLTISHSESGEGISKRRRSLVRVDKTIPGQFDTTRLEKVSFYAVADIPVGNMSAYTEATKVCANLVSFLASRGATTTILYDGTGCGAEALINGSL
jgi:hypothetical protein